MVGYDELGFAFSPILSFFLVFVCERLVLSLWKFYCVWRECSWMAK